MTPWHPYSSAGLKTARVALTLVLLSIARNRTKINKQPGKQLVLLLSSCFLPPHESTRKNKMNLFLLLYPQSTGLIVGIQALPGVAIWPAGCYGQDGTPAYIFRYCPRTVSLGVILVLPCTTQKPTREKHDRVTMAHETSPEHPSR